MCAGPSDYSCGGYCAAYGTDCCSDASYSGGYVPCCNSTGEFVACTGGNTCVPDYVDTYSSCCATVPLTRNMLPVLTDFASSFRAAHCGVRHHPVVNVSQKGPRAPQLEILRLHSRGKPNPPTIAQVVPI